MPAILNEHQQWVDTSGKPLVGGKVYFGNQGADPKTSPQDIFSDREFTTPLAQPQLLDSNGRTANKVWIKGRYSILVDDLNDVQQYLELDNGDPEAVGIVTLDNVQGATDISATGTPTVTAYVDKETYILKTVSINGTPVTLDIDGVGSRPVTYPDGSQIPASQWLADQIVSVVYNETSDTFVWEQFDLMSQAEAEAGTALIGRVVSAERLDQAITALAPDKTLRRQVFDASGTWTRPTDVTIANVMSWGAGASGGGDISDGGGGAGEYAEARVTGLAADVTVTVGAGGAAVATGDGNAGGNTSFGAFVIANGGSANIGAAGGLGGTGGTGDFTRNGGEAASGFGNPGAEGGHSPFGGAGGAGTRSSINATQTPGYPGGGGPGTGSDGAALTLPGSDGCVIVEWME